MRYIGNKENLVEKIAHILDDEGIEGTILWDFFAGTTGFSRYFKKLNWQIISSDFMYLSYCLQKAYLENNVEPRFTKLLSTLNATSSFLFDNPLEIVLERLNSISVEEGFIYRNYTPEGTANDTIQRRYFTGENGKRIDSVRNCIERWNKNGLLQENEYYILQACLLESVSLFANVAGVYAAFSKKWDPRAVKKFIVKPIKLVYGSKPNRSFWTDSLTLCDKIDNKIDLLYLDPPYNQRQYAPNYHLLETIARWDSPIISGVSGMRDYSAQKSTFCNPTKGLRSLDYIAGTVNYRTLVLSYNTEGIMSKDSIINVLKQYGTVELAEFQYSRFKSNDRIANAPTTVMEQLYILKR